LKYSLIFKASILGIITAITVGCAGVNGGAASGKGASSSTGKDATDSAKRKDAVAVTQTSKGVQITSDERILFDTGKSVIKTDGKVYIKRVADILKTKTKANVEIEGHTDNVGNVKYNQTLSDARANSVKAALIQEGVEAKRIMAKGYGMTKPVAENTTPEGKQANRRTDIQVLGETVENIAPQGSASLADKLQDGLTSFLKDPIGTLKDAFGS
jgi:outer membrane protein OmpA-like peptidoglycan-associated protein